MKIKIGIALSGGGVRGAAHIGVLRALNNAGINIDMISGTSSGSIVAALYAIGYTPREIEAIFLISKKVADVDYKGIGAFLFKNIVKRQSKLEGILKGNTITKGIKQTCQFKGKCNLKDTCIPLAIPAVDINTAETVFFVSDKKICKCSLKDAIYIEDTKIWEAVRASTAVPIVFKPLYFKGRRLVDGGITDNVPVDILRCMGAEKVLAVNLGYAGQIRKDIDNMLEIARQSIDIMSYKLSKYELRNAEYVINPKIYDVGLLEMDRIQECIDRGYIAARKELPKIKTILKVDSKNTYYV